VAGFDEQELLLGLLNPFPVEGDGLLASMLLDGEWIAESCRPADVDGILGFAPTAGPLDLDPMRFLGDGN
jgi:hypothetical protein